MNNEEIKILIKIIEEQTKNIHKLNERVKRLEDININPNTIRLN